MQQMLGCFDLCNEVQTANTAEAVRAGARQGDLGSPSVLHRQQPSHDLTDARPPAHPVRELQLYRRSVQQRIIHSTESACMWQPPGGAVRCGAGRTAFKSAAWASMVDDCRCT